MTSQTVTQTVTLLVLTPVQVLTTTLPAAVQGQAYTVQLTAAGGVGPYTWVGVSLPAGLSLSADGLLSGTPPAAGSFTLTVQVTDTGA